MTGDTYEIDGLAVPEGVARLHDLLERVAADHPAVPATDVLMFETAVMELANNVVEHGRPVGEVTWSFRLVVDTDTLAARLADSGEEYTGWDPGQPQEMPDLMAESGRGLALASAVLDELSYRREDGVNVWSMVRRWGV